MFLRQLPATKSIMHQKYEGMMAVGSALQSSVQLSRRPSGVKQDFCTSLSNIVTSYLQHQHSSCRNPIVTCPPFSLLAWVLLLLLLTLTVQSVVLLLSYTVRVKKNPAEVFWHFFQNGWELLVQILHTYYTFISMLEYKFLFNYLQLWRCYAILSATTEFTSCAHNVHHRPIRTQCLHAQFVVVGYFTH